MKYRILGFLLAVVMIVTILPMTALAAETAAPKLQISERGLAMIKRFEGLSKTPVSDGKQWAIGYGMACNPADYPNSITEEQADALLREKMTYFEDCVNRYTGRYGIVLSQNQFDALVSMTFNLGGAWINSNYRFWSMLRGGLEQYTDNQIASAMGVWCHVGGKVSTGLLQRRMEEIGVFLYGDYDRTDGVTFSYLIFDGAQGTVDTDILLYRADQPYAAFPATQRSGFEFSGWYTAKTGGTRVDAAEMAVKSGTVYARWAA